jgi:hypothetical protein
MSGDNNTKSPGSPRISISMDEPGDMKFSSSKKRNDLMSDRFAKIFPSRHSLAIFVTYMILLTFQGK